jgi:type IV secretory pathway VirB9-like protein
MNAPLLAPLLAVLAFPVDAVAPAAAPVEAAASADATPALADPIVLTQEFQRTGKPPTLEGEHAALVPFGHGHPVVSCAPLRACAIELESGETVLSTSTGDSERWLVQMAATGGGSAGGAGGVGGVGGATPLLVVKPTACDLATNLLVATDRRLYEIGLDSPPCHDADRPDAEATGRFNPTLPYRGVTRFYYPDQLVRSWNEAETAARAAAAERERHALPLGVEQLTSLHFTYTWNRERRFPWTPSQIFDDGRHTVIVLPPDARDAEAPALFVFGEHGVLTLLNYHAEHGTYVADRVLDHAVLVAGGDSQKPARLEIVNHAHREP